MSYVQINFKKIGKDLDRISDIFKNQKKYKLFRTMSSLLLKSYWGETFDKEGQRRGHPKWEPLNPTYSHYKEMRGKSVKPLILDGHLRGSAEVLYETNNELSYGTKAPYSEYHQKGDGVPQREIIFLTESDFGEILELLTTLTLDVIEDILKT